MDEFELIDQIFHRPEGATPQVALGIGDDGAVLNGTAGKQSVVVMHTLGTGVHFWTLSHPIQSDTVPSQRT